MDMSHHREPRLPQETAMAAGRFSKYSPESERQSRAPHVRQNKAMDAIFGAWSSFKFPFSKVMEWDLNKRILEGLDGVCWGAKEVELFAIMASDFQDESRYTGKLGVFLSALVEGGKDACYSIPLGHLGRRLNLLAYRNTKDVVLVGDVGNDACTLMNGGSVTIEGDAGESLAASMQGGNVRTGGSVGKKCGFGMSDGLIEVAGNAGPMLGLCMQGGRIAVSGNASQEAGREMRGGEILIAGDSAWYAGQGMEGGTIRICGGAAYSTGMDMKGGLLEVKGDAGRHLGYRMKGGLIVVHGNAGEDVALGMGGGTIRIEKGFLSIACHDEGGEVFANGKRVR
jgi:formylmethanofuran dehydrogenase subunit C